MSAPPADATIAVFLDLENIVIGSRDAGYAKFNIQKVLERLLVKGHIVVKKAYCDFERYKDFKRDLHEAAFELIEIPHVRMSGKNSADIRMVVDALDLCYMKGHVDTFAIISGDSDFSPLVSKLRENAKKVIGVGVKNSTSDLFINNCDEFIYYDDLVRVTRPRATTSRRSSSSSSFAASAAPAASSSLSSNVPAASNSPTPAAPPTAIPGANGSEGENATTLPAPDTAPTRARRTTAPRRRRPSARSAAASPIEAAAQAPEELLAIAPDASLSAVAPIELPPIPAAFAAEVPSTDDNDGPSPEKAFELLMATLEVLGQERGDKVIWGSMIKRAMKRRNPGFNERAYGFRSFSDLLSEGQKRGIIKLSADEKSGDSRVEVPE